MFILFTQFGYSKMKKSVSFEKLIRDRETILTEGSILERLKLVDGIKLDPHIMHAGLIYMKSSRTILAEIYHSYLSIGYQFGFPMITLAPTWRANPERILKSNIPNKTNVNNDCVQFLQKLKNYYGDYKNQIFIGGMMACRGDAYNPQEALTQDNAVKFHSEQAVSLADSGVDFIKAATLPALSEALGITDLLSKFTIPYVLSFVVRPTGTLLDGTPIEEAVNQIDEQSERPPLFYMVNCVHATILDKAFAKVPHKIIRRFSGFQANTSSKTPKELELLTYLDSQEPVEFAQEVVDICKKYQFSLIGGCCGSDDRHIRKIAQLLSKDSNGG